MKTDPFSRCEICGTSLSLERHHVFFGSGLREQSERYGMVAILCAAHHRGQEGVHFNREFDVWLKRKFQAEFERTHTRAEFRRIFGRSWL